jgi:hypothetical protein
MNDDLQKQYHNRSAGSLLARCAACVVPVLVFLCILVLVFKVLQQSRAEERARFKEIEDRTRRIQDESFKSILDGLKGGRLHSFEASYDDFDHLGEKLEQVGRLHGVESIVLEGTDVTDMGVKSISTLPNLDTFAVLGGAVSDSGMECLRGNKSIQDLMLCSTNVTGQGLRVVETLPNLRIFTFEKRQTTARDVVGPHSAPYVNSLISALKELRQLKTLEVGGEWVTGEVVDDLQKSLPNTKIIRLTNGSDMRHEVL